MINGKHKEDGRNKSNILVITLIRLKSTMKVKTLRLDLTKAKFTER